MGNGGAIGGFEEGRIIFWGWTMIWFGKASMLSEGLDGSLCFGALHRFFNGKLHVFTILEVLVDGGWWLFVELVEHSDGKIANNSTGGSGARKRLFEQNFLVGVLGFIW